MHSHCTDILSSSTCSRCPAAVPSSAAAVTATTAVQGHEEGRGAARPGHGETPSASREYCRNSPLVN